MTKDDRICLGRIVGVHGIKGEVKVKSFTECDVDIDKYGPVYNKDNSKSFDIKVVGHSKELLRVKIKGIDDRTIAEALKGTDLYVLRSVLPELKDEDEFYQTDLIDLDVKIEDSEEVIGKVSGIYNFGAGDVLEIKFSDKSIHMIPFTKQYVPVVDIKNGYIIVKTAEMQFVEDEGEELC